MENKKVKEFLKRRNKNEDVVDSYYKTVLESEKINPYKEVIQTGAKEGQSLYSHVENMSGVTAGLIELLNINNIESKVLLTAIAIHDLNKVPEYLEYKAYLDIISEEDKDGNFINLINECEKIGISDFFKNYKDYIYDIREIIGRHSAHLNNYGETYYCNSNTQLDSEVIEKLVNIIRAVDCIDLSKEFQEKKKKQQFLQQLNKVSVEKGKMFELVYHKFSENRGDLSNIINSLVIKGVKKKKLIPLLLYREGTFYLAEKNRNLENINKKELIKDIVIQIKKQVLNDLENFIVNKQAGIVVDEKAFEISTIEEIIWRINTRADEFKPLNNDSVQKKNNNINLSFDVAREIYNECDSEDLNSKIKTIENVILDLEEKKSIADKKELKVINKSLKEKEKELVIFKEKLSGYLGYKKMMSLIGDNQFQLNINEEVLKLSEFIRAMYSLLNTYVTNKKTKLAWEQMYEVLKLNAEDIGYLNLIEKEALYHRPYLIGEMLFDKYKDEKREILIEIFIQYFEKMIVTDKVNENDMWRELEKYIDKNLSFSFVQQDIILYKNALSNYINKKSGNCTLCGSDFEATDWMAVDIPKKLISVQQFSNRLRAGVNEPRRKVCNICRIEYLLKKASYSTKVEVSRRYISIYPKGFYTTEKMKFLKESFSEFNKRDINAIFFDAYTSYCEIWGEKEIKTPKFSAGKVYGMSVPSSKEFIGNTVTLPMNFDLKSIDSKIYIDVLMQAVYFNKYFDMKISVTEQSYMLNNFDTENDIYIPSVPIMYSKLFNENLTKVQVEATFRLFVNLFGIAKILGQGCDYIYDGLRALNYGRLNFIYELHKKIKSIEANSKKKNKELSIITQLKNSVAKVLEYMEVEKVVTDLEKLAIYANDEKIFGSLGGYLKDYSIIKPLNLIFDNVIKADLSVRPIKDIRATIINEIQDYFKRIYSGKLSNEKRKKIEIYVDMFFETVFENSYSLNLRKLERDRKKIVSAYVYYFRKYQEKNREGI